MVLQVEEMIFPENQKKSAEWVEDALLLYETNPNSALQLIEELLKKFPDDLEDEYKMTTVKDLIQMYQDFDRDEMLSLKLSRNEFIEGFDSRFHECRKENIEDQLELEKKLMSQVNKELSHLLGTFIAKLQYMEEISEESREKKGKEFAEETYILLSINRESTLQIILGMISRLVKEGIINGIFLTSREIEELLWYIGIDRLKEMEIEKDSYDKGYERQVAYFRA